MVKSRLTPSEMDTKRKQSVFIAIFSNGASLRSAAKEADVNRATVYRWIENDYLGFRERYDAAHADFKDSLIEMALHRVNDQKSSDSPLLLITLLNAYIPEKFRPNTIATEEVAKDTIKELRELSKRAFKANPATKEEQMTSKSPLQQVEDIILEKKAGNGD
jgi:AcrR family transcriptional regulator